VFFKKKIQFLVGDSAFKNVALLRACYDFRCSRGAFDSAKNHKRQRLKRQSVPAKREKSQTPKFV